MLILSSACLHARNSKEVMAKPNNTDKQKFIALIRSEAVRNIQICYSADHDHTDESTWHDI